MRRFHLFWLMTRKNFIVIRRSPVWTFFEIILPLGFGLLISYLIFKQHDLDMEIPKNMTITLDEVSLVNSNNTRFFGGPPIFSVRDGVNKTAVQLYMHKLCDGLRCPIYIDSKSKMLKKLESESVMGIFIDEFTLDTQTLAYEFHIPEYRRDRSTTTIQLQHVLNAAFFQVLNLSSLPDVRVEKFTFNKGQLLIWVAIFPYFYLLYFILILPTMMHTGREIAAEKERGMKDFLDVMGLKPLNFIFSHIFLGSAKGAIVVISVSIMPALRLSGIWGEKGNINIWIFVIPLFLYDFAAMIFASLIASLFKTSNSTIKAIAILHPLLVFFAVWSLSNASVFSPVFAAIASLNYNTALANIFVVLGNYLKRNRRLTYCDVFEQNDLMLNIGPLVLILFLDIIWMSLLVWFIEAHRKINIMESLKKLLYKQNVEQMGTRKFSSDDSTWDAIEKLDNSMLVDVEVTNVSKKWGASNDYAVCDMNLQACRGEITVLLGHNGAGKSTTFSMICGITTPSSGVIKVTPDQLGYCPQENALFEKLTVEEHLWFFHHIKKSKNDWREEMNDLLSSLKMADKIHENVLKLSGGMKRKLCLAMALIGDSRVVLLDEPTAGIDVGARHDVQRMLAEQKRNRTILFTTHYMDEAEALGDRIAIMVKGRCVAAGSPEFLKLRFDTGYVLTCVLNDQVASSPLKVKAFVQKLKALVPKAKFDEDTSIHGKQFEILLPIEVQPEFSRIFNLLEEEEDVSTFGLSINNLEQVFLKVGEMVDRNEATESIEDQDDHIINQKQDNKLVSFIAILGALMKKRIYFALRNWHQAIFQLVIPIAIIILCVLLTNRQTEETPETAETKHSMEFSNLGNAKFFLASSVTSPYLSMLNAAKRAKNLKVIKIDGRDYNKELETQPNDLPTSFFGINLSNVSFPIFFYSNEDISNADWFQMVLFNSLANSQLQSSGGGSISLKLSNFKSTIAPPENDDFLMNTLVLGLLSVIVFAMLTSPFSIFYVVEQVSKFWHQQRLSGVSPMMIHLTSIFFDLITFMMMSLFICLGFYLGGWTSEKLRVIWLLVDYFFATMANICLLSSFFNSPSKANVLIMIYQTIGAYGSLFVVTTMYTFAKDKVDAVAIPLQILFPSFGLCWGIWSCRILTSPSSFSPEAASTAAAAAESYDMTLLILFLTGFAQFILVFLWRSSFLRYKLTRVLCKYPKHYQPVSNDIAMQHITEFDAKSGNPPVLELTNLTKKYGDKLALDSLTFEVMEGECFGLLGVNGAGKTTTFSLITGEQFANSGHVKLNGDEIKGITKMGYCPQFDAFMVDLTGREVLTILATLYDYKYPKKKADSVLRAVLMDKHGDKQLKHCSGGQKRKISVGIALLAHSSLVILDEPTAGIDPKARREIWSLIGKFKVRKNSAVLLCSHSMDECEALCNRVGILVDGKLTALGTTQELKSRYGNSYELTLVYSNDETQVDFSKRTETMDETSHAACSASTQRLCQPYVEFSKSEESMKTKRIGIDIQRTISQYFPGASMRTDGVQTNVFHFTVPRQMDDKWSNLWERTDRIASLTNATNYYIAQNTLLQTFLLLSGKTD